MGIDAIDKPDFSTKWTEVVKDKQITQLELNELKKTAQNTESKDDDKLVDELQKIFDEGKTDKRDIKTIIQNSEYCFDLNLEGTFNFTPNYSNPDLYLKVDDQTNIKGQVAENYKLNFDKIDPLINDNKNISTIKQIFNLVHAVAPYGRPDTFKITSTSLNELEKQGLDKEVIKSLNPLLNKEFANSADFVTELDKLKLLPKQKDLIIKNAQPPLFVTSALDVLNQGYATGCTNFAIAFAAIAREKGIPAIVVNSAGKEWLETKDPKAVQGHYFVELYAKDENGKAQWFLFDSSSGNLYKDYDPNNPNLPGSSGSDSPKGYVVVSKNASLEKGANETTHNQIQIDRFDGKTVTYVAPDYKFENLYNTDMQADFLIKNPLLNEIPKVEYMRPELEEKVYPVMKPSGWLETVKAIND